MFRDPTDYRPPRLLPSFRRQVSKVRAPYCLEYDQIVSEFYAIAVRKNRYVVLPVDFEEAWKVRCLVVFGAPRLGYIGSTHLSFSPPSSQQTVKRGDETHEFCTSSGIRYIHVAFLTEIGSLQTDSSLVVVS